MNDKTEDVCMYCGGTGRTSEDPFKCHHCGAEFHIINKTDKIELNNIYIPQKYREERWSVDKIKEHLKTMSENAYKRQEMFKWADVLDILIKATNNRELNKTNLIYLYARPGNGVRRWAYTLISDAEKIGYNVEGIIDLIDVDLDDEEYINSIMTKDIIIYRLVNYKIEESLQKLNYIIPKRQERDYVTIIISNLPYTFVSNKIDYMNYNKPLLIENMN